MIPDDELQAMRLACSRGDGNISYRRIGLQLCHEIDRLKAELAASEVHWTTKDPLPKDSP